MKGRHTTRERQIHVLYSHNLDEDATAFLAIFIDLLTKRLILINSGWSLQYIALTTREWRNSSTYRLLLREATCQFHTGLSWLSIPGLCCPSLLAGFAG
jgi:hypothetical protein